MKVASVIINNPSREVDREFDYYIPTELEDIVSIGSSIIVPFGMYNNYKEGYILNIKDETDFKGKELKKIVDILDEEITLSEELLSLAKYMKEEYLCTLSEALRVMTPPKKSFKEILYIRFLKFEETLSKRLKKILLFISEFNLITLNEINKKTNYKVKKSDLILLRNIGCIELTKDFVKHSSKKEITVYLLESEKKCKELLESKTRARKQLELVEILLNSGKKEFTLESIINDYNGSTYAVKELVKKNVLIKESKQVFRELSKNDYIYNRFTLNNEQKQVVDNIIDNFKYGKNISLIHGVTGSGKTEVYLNLVERFLKEDYGAIIMVPEIALTPQTVERFRGRFNNKVAVVHSRLSGGERYDQFLRIKSGEYKVVVGVRSAVFSPVKDLKLIIIDEEQENSYKSEMNPRYLTHNIAKFRANKLNACLVLGSATPSIESYYKAMVGEYNLEKITKRIEDIPLPEVLAVDMRGELLYGNKSIFSRELHKGINENLETGSQTILFLNRRGHSTFVSCRKCGYVCECENCSITLTYHNKHSRLKCHQCGKEYNIPTVCPKCKSKYIKYFGVGTEKVQKEVEKEFNTQSVIRMDSDTTKRKGNYEKFYSEFKNKEKSILIGTQMIAKGMDFKDVTLVGVISADISLNLPDFRAEEKTFQILTQVAGRAGRGKNKGKVIIQTYNPDDYAIKYAIKHDYEGFFQREIQTRKLLDYPPFSGLINIMFISENEDMLENNMDRIGKIFKNSLKNKNVSILGPAPCGILKIKNKYRWHVILKGDISKIKREVFDLLQKNVQNKDISYMIDVDPYMLI